ncbi:MAG: acetyl-CoA carboxylase biotin carboxyl carrier protein [Planctomycetota bacterium]|jgi:acetyl-CoA carboxylase biotin carboxyl carrier protein
MEYDLESLKKLTRFMSEHGLVELEVADASEHVRLRRPEILEAIPARPAGETAAAETSDPEKAPEPESHAVDFAAPMVGTFHLAAQDAESFVQVGSEVNAKTVLCIIEAMSVPNEIRASVTGKIAEILATDGQPVEFGTPLFRIEVRKN